jgi:Phytanoyl-CoA dioxygenase (PhyH)
MKVRVFGRDLLLTREAGSWEVFDVGSEGKKRRATDIVVPEYIGPEETLQYLTDLLHEFATPGNEDAYLLEAYESKGYQKAPRAFTNKGLDDLLATVNAFHSHWLKENAEAFEAGALNSANLTASSVLDSEQRLQLFKFISSREIREVIAQTPLVNPVFINTQLFFDPYNPAQKNYWHRDPQYHLDIEGQQQVIRSSEVIHFRIALTDDPGVEVIPGTHRRWDSPLELNTRLEQSGRKNWEELEGSQALALDPGDVLAFSANMIHRGLYGGGRMALDILLGEEGEEVASFIQLDNLPDESMYRELEHADLFERARSLKQSQSKSDTESGM